MAVEGDTVTVRYKCMNPKGEVGAKLSRAHTIRDVISQQPSCLNALQIIETSDSSEPLTFEVGAGEIMGNKMFQVKVCPAAPLPHTASEGVL